MSEPDNLVLQLLRDIGEDIAGLDRKIDKQGDELRAEFRSEIHSLRVDVASDLMTMEKRLNEQFVGLRRSVMEYHQRLEITPPESH